MHPRSYTPTTGPLFPELVAMGGQIWQMASLALTPGYTFILRQFYQLHISCNNYTNSREITVTNRPTSRFSLMHHVHHIVFSGWLHST